MKTLLILCLMASPSIACQPQLDTKARDALITQTQEAANEMAARVITNQLWELWATAPDSHAQELLDIGLERRSSFDLSGAVTAFDALIAYCPAYAEGYNQRAFVRFMRQEHQEALEDLDQALERDPLHVAALAGKALTLQELGREPEAQRVLRAALALNPWLPERRFLKEIKGDDI